MRTLLNIIWLVFAGFWLALGYVFAGIVCCVLIVTIPFGIASFRIAGYALWPFGRTVVDKPTAGAWSTIGNVIWFVVAGIWLAIGHVLTSIPLFLSIIGIPLGIANLKMIPVSLLPLGKDIVPVDAARGYAAYGQYPGQAYPAQQGYATQQYPGQQYPGQGPVPPK
ncbi:uncharacterized membrane protein YccF (DUF307 family) [Sediminihabitans luteus]|uniref:Uncharacterized membrane protein YccF (DUF307 family) n=1 Tax=Sediminihabitans luteus TaxID=1138585 RepID=A0A2M9CPE7_9CELL|nr:uncharacterized membrane protein YccF (DUF307 family) [Sediminihabitans luteus]GIJ00541.1 hypothetical protein Slu03_29180 [Sediminihabitans luteus]